MRKQFLPWNTRKKLGSSFLHQKEEKLYDRLEKSLENTRMLLEV